MTDHPLKNSYKKGVVGDVDAFVEEWASDAEAAERDEAPGEEGRVGVGGFLDDEVYDLDGHDLGQRKGSSSHVGRRRVEVGREGLAGGGQNRSELARSYLLPFHLSCSGV